jgi:diaminopimelate decarboxylase
MTQAPSEPSPIRAPTVIHVAFSHQDGVLHAESVPLSAIAEQFGTPTYVYSKAQLLRTSPATPTPAPGRDALVCYAMKANSNLAILDLLARGRRLRHRLGRRTAARDRGRRRPGQGDLLGRGQDRGRDALALEKGILCFNVESIPELHRLNEVAGRMGKRAPVSLRVNPNVDAKTHPYIATGLKANKFGVAFDDALATYRTAAALPHLDVVGIDCHIGSQLLDDAPLLEALDKLIELIDTLAPKASTCTTSTSAAAWASTTAPATSRRCRWATTWARVFARIDAWRAEKHDGKPIKVIFEPGRSIVGNAGVLLTTGRIPEAGRGKELLRDRRRHERHDAPDPVPGLDGREAGHPARRRRAEVRPGRPGLRIGRLAGARPRLAVEPGDLLAMMTAGAYGMTMASNYNTRGRAAEVLVDGDQVHLIRRARIRPSCSRWNRC